MSFAFEKTPRMSLSCKLVPVQYRVYEYGLLLSNKFIGSLFGLQMSFSITFSCESLHIFFSESLKTGNEKSKESSRQLKTEIDVGFSV